MGWVPCGPVSSLSEYDTVASTPAELSTHTRPTEPHANTDYSLLPTVLLLSWLSSDASVCTIPAVFLGAAHLPRSLRSTGLGGNICSLPAQSGHGLQF